MNKKELATVVLLILLIPVWLFIDSRFIKPRVPDVPAPSPEPAEVSESPTPSTVPSAPAESEEPSAAAPAVVQSGAESPQELVPSEEAVEEQVLHLSNEVLTIKLSNLGASVLEATLHAYPATLEDKENVVLNPVVMDFSRLKQPALSYDMPGANAGSAFTVSEGADGSIVFSRRVLPELTFEREFSLGEGYEITVMERWINQGEADILIPKMNVFLGPMYPQENISQKFGPFIGIDARHTGGVGVKHYVKQLRKETGRVSGMYEHVVNQPLDWFSVKNKFFTQVLTFRSTDWLAAESLTLRARKGEEGDVAIGFAQPSASIRGVELIPGQVMERDLSFYVGPISMDNLQKLGNNQHDLIDFRLFRIFVPLGKGMMWGLNRLHSLTGNWGVSIILLTFVVRMLFWPLTQKGAENMKKMSELSPQMKELREKHKNNPQKLNQEMSAFYKQNKVNPMAGCLPMVVQIPVFISLYGVLRVAVELRFAEFLWITDLSEQEALFFIAGFPVNILPLTMGATMVLQQKLTPSNMDPQQKKIMMMMPIVFLFICYSMPAGLLLYWTTSNLISIYQTTHTRKRDAKKAAANGGPAVSPTVGKGNMKPVSNPKSIPSKPTNSKKNSNSKKKK